MVFVLVRQDAGDGIYCGEFFPKTQPFGPMFIGFQRVAKDAAFCGLFVVQRLDYKGLDCFLCGIPGFDTVNDLAPQCKSEPRMAERLSKTTSTLFGFIGPKGAYVGLEY
ncbi:hypothetical protein D3C81_1784530 [compost metagenome]